jgi:hypothetical protein
MDRRSSDVLAWLGISVATANDTAFVGSCTDAANAFAFRRRKEAGYFDSLTTVPGADVKLAAQCWQVPYIEKVGALTPLPVLKQ